MCGCTTAKNQKEAKGVAARAPSEPAAPGTESDQEENHVLSELPAFQKGPGSNTESEVASDAEESAGLPAAVQEVLPDPPALKSAAVNPTIAPPEIPADATDIGIDIDEQVQCVSPGQKRPGRRILEWKEINASIRRSGEFQKAFCSGNRYLSVVTKHTGFGKPLLEAVPYLFFQRPPTTTLLRQCAVVTGADKWDKILHNFLLCNEKFGKDVLSESVTVSRRRQFALHSAARGSALCVRYPAPEFCPSPGPTLG